MNGDFDLVISPSLMSSKDLKRSISAGERLICALKQSRLFDRVFRQEEETKTSS